MYWRTDVLAQPMFAGQANYTAQSNGDVLANLTRVCWGQVERSGTSQLMPSTMRMSRTAALPITFNAS